MSKCVLFKDGVDDEGNFCRMSKDCDCGEVEAAADAMPEPVAWSYCPECGSKKYAHLGGEGVSCQDCGQEWFSDIDYTETVRSNLARSRLAPPPAPAVPEPVARNAAFYLLMRDICESEEGDLRDEHSLCLDYDWLHQRIEQAMFAPPAAGSVPAVPDYLQAKKALELYESEYVGQKHEPLWSWAWLAAASPDGEAGGSHDSL